MAVRAEWMFASVSSVLLSKTGPMGVELIRELFRPQESGPVTRFVTTNPREANAADIVTLFKAAL